MRSDAAIQRDVIEELRYDGRVPDAAIGVGVSGAVVTLSGEVDDCAARAAAGEVAHRVPGVLDVVDHLEIRQPAVLLADGLHIRDAEVAEAIRRALVLVADARHADVMSTVSRGRVVLEGLVEDPPTRERAARAVAAVPGVAAVVNHLHVPRPDDGPDFLLHG
jgi:osmotically-inducible protein OsmY